MLLYIRPLYSETHGIKVLLAAILRRACFDIAMYKDARDLRRHRLWEDAHNWMFDTTSTGVDSFTSFVSICTILDQDPERIRGLTLKLTRKDVKKFEMVSTHDGIQRY